MLLQLEGKKPSILRFCLVFFRCLKTLRLQIDAKFFFLISLIVELSLHRIPQSKRREGGRTDQAFQLHPADSLRIRLLRFHNNYRSYI